MTDARDAPAQSLLTVERVRVSVLCTPDTADVPMSFGRLDHRQVCIVEVSAGGVVGVGESWMNYPSWAAAERMATLCQGVAPRLIGMDAADPPATLDRLCHDLLPIGRQAGSLGAMWQALSGVDIALWDLAARARGRSVAQLLAAEPHDPHHERTHVPAYGSGVGPTQIDQCCARALEVGLGAVKTKIGFGEDRDRETLRRTRAAVGHDVAIFADANQGWSVPDARAMLPTLADHGVEWLEEPVAGDAVADLEELASTPGCPAIATGENVYGLEAFEGYAASPAVTFLQPDLAKSGGLSIARRVADEAATHGTALAPHCYSSALGLAADLQLGAAYPGVAWIELDIRDNPLRTALLREPLQVDHGALRIPTGPGLGVELDPTTMQRFLSHSEEITSHDR